MLTLRSAGRRGEGAPAPPPPLHGTPLCRWEKQNNAKKDSAASSQMHFLRSTSCGRSLKAAPGLSLGPLPSSLTCVSRLLMSLLPPCCRVTDQQRLLLAASPVDTVVMSLSPGSTIWQPRPPDGRRHWFTALGSRGAWRRGGPQPRRSTPLHAPAEVND